MLKHWFKRIDANKKEQYIRKAIIIFFVYSGFWKSKSNHQLNFPLAVFHLLALLAGFFSTSYMFILKYDEIDIFTETLIHLVQIFHTISYHLILITRKKSLDQLADVLFMSVDDMNLPPKDRMQYAVIIQKERDACLRVLAGIVYVAAVVYVIVFMDSVLHYLRGDHKLLFYSWFPFETGPGHKWTYFLAILFEAMMYADFLLIRSCVWVLWFWTIHLVCGMLGVVGSGIKKYLDESNTMHPNVENAEALNKNVKHKWVVCVDLHVRARRLVSKLNLSMPLGLFSLVLTFEGAICFCAFHVVEAAKTGELYRMLKFFSGAVLFLQVLYATCATGQKLINRSEELYQTFYSCGWPGQAQSVKTSIYICQTVSKKPLKIHDGNVIHADLHAFVFSMKAIYSYLNFLEAMKDKI